MEFIYNVEENRERIKKVIAQHGHTPEHNFDWYMCVTEPKEVPVVILWDDGTGLLGHKEKTEWSILEEPLAPATDALNKIFTFTDKVFEDSTITKVVLELRAPLRRELLKTIPKTLRARAINYTLHWPVTNLKKFDPDLPGRRWKHIRNARNKFYRDNAVEVIDAHAVDKNLYHETIDRWKKFRGGSDRAYAQRYRALVDSNFKCAEGARAFVVNGMLRGFNAGWMIPNTNTYYGAIGIHDYSYSDLGTVLYLEDLVWMKKAGYEYADLGGIEKSAAGFKNQFLPDHWYKSFIFALGRA